MAGTDTPLPRSGGTAPDPDLERDPDSNLIPMKQPSEDVSEDSESGLHWPYEERQYRRHWRKRRAQESGLSVTSLLVLMFGAVVLIGLAILLGIVAHQQKGALTQLAVDDARHTADMAVEHLHSLMRMGADREELVRAMDAHRLKREELSLEIYRSAAVEDLFGTLPETGQAGWSRLPEVAKVMQTGEVGIFDSTETLRFLSPIMVREDCVVCHVNTDVGDINGVIDISFPVAALRAPMESVLGSTFQAIGLAIVALFLVLYVTLKLCIDRPIVGLTGHMQGVMGSGNFAERVRLKSHWPKELKVLARDFNTLLDDVEEGTKKLRDQSERDPLTGLYNRRHFDHAVGRELIRSKRYNGHATVCLIDLNGFKPINDSYGHAAGDMVLNAIAQSLSKGLRDSDIVARVGGDEFAVLAPESHQSDAVMLAEKLRALVSRTTVPIENTEGGMDGSGPTTVLRVGAAVGTAVFPQDGSDPAALMDVADSAMYVDKARQKAGRKAAG